MRLQVLIDHEIKKLSLNGGILSVVNELVEAIKDAYSITSEIRLQYKDDDFDYFYRLNDNDTHRAVYVPHTITLIIVP